MARRRSIAILISAVLVLGAACSGSKRTIRIPESVVANPKNKKEHERQAMEPYVVKMSDGKHVYELRIPAGLTTGAYQASIPLDYGEFEAEGTTGQTEADREIIDAKKASGEPTPKEKPGEAPKARSYLGTLAKVNALFKKRQYELALIELTALDREYPEDERILEMKGTLLWKLKRPKQAREAWERVLAINPNNTVVAQALEQLAQDGE
jgi:tetratricopeptide (TPR) repeat protein